MEKSDAEIIAEDLIIYVSVSNLQKLVSKSVSPQIIFYSFRDIFFYPKYSYSIEEEGFPTFIFENKEIAVVSPDGVKVIIEENQVQVKFDSFTSSDKKESLSTLFTPDKCLIERNSANDEDRWV